MYIFCNNGNIISSESTDVAMNAYNSLWYRYSLSLQPFMVLILRRSQQPFVFKGFKMANCNLETFKKVFVIKKCTVLQYFSMNFVRLGNFS